MADNWPERPNKWTFLEAGCYFAAQLTYAANTLAVNIARLAELRSEQESGRRVFAEQAALAIETITGGQDG